jgi:hypothetical protein
MQLPYDEKINIAAIGKKFYDTFGQRLYWNVAPNTNWAVFDVGRGEPLTLDEKSWLRTRYKVCDEAVYGKIE